MSYLKRYIFLGGIFLSMLVGTTHAQAALLYIDPPVTEIYPGDTIAVAVRLDTEAGECINAIDGVLTYDSGIIPVDISRGDSILPVWVEEPTIDIANGRITFAGGVPNGYCGRVIGDPRLTNIILEIIFQAPGLQIGSNNNATATVAFAPETRVFLNDGRGTLANVNTIDGQIGTNPRPRGQVVDEWNSRVIDDTTAPRDFSIALESSPSIYGGRYFITFNTTDKESGLDHYQVMEEPLEQFNLFGWGAVGAPWKMARSPYLLEDQTLNSTIRVKAVDKAGNEYLAVLVPDPELRGTPPTAYVTYGLMAAGILILVVVLVTMFVVWRRSKKLSDDDTTEEYDEYGEDE